MQPIQLKCFSTAVCVWYGIRKHVVFVILHEFKIGINFVSPMASRLLSYDSTTNYPTASKVKLIN